MKAVSKMCLIREKENIYKIGQTKLSNISYAVLGNISLVTKLQVIAEMFLDSPPSELWLI